MRANALPILAAFLVPLAAIGASAACGGLVQSSDETPQIAAQNDDASVSAIDRDAGNPFAIVCDGGPAADPSRTCAISFATDILPLMLADGEWGCAASKCHSSADGVPPIIDAKDISGTWWRFVQFDIEGVPYVNPCTKSTTASSLLGNLSSPPNRGTHMPLGDDSLPTIGEITNLLEPWVACGSPLN